MKLHLPNLLRKALLACVSSTATFSLTLGSGFVAGGALVVAFLAEEAQAYTLDIKQKGALYADSYTFTFYIEDAALLSHNLTLGAYYGDDSNQAQGANGFVFVEDEGSYYLKVGQGAYNQTTYTFTFHSSNNVKLDLPLEAQKLYTVSGTVAESGNGMTMSITDGVSSWTAPSAYAAGMNGNGVGNGNLLSSYYNQSFTNEKYCWAAQTEAESVWNATNENWTQIGDDVLRKYDAAWPLLFTSGAVYKNVSIEGEVSAGRVIVQDAYTFTSKAAGAKISAENIQLDALTTFAASGEGATGEVAGVISGSGGVLIESGNWTFRGTNTYTGGTTIAKDATLTLIGGGVSGAIRGEVRVLGRLVLADLFTAGYSTENDGHMSLIHIGSPTSSGATLTLRGTEDRNDQIFAAATFNIYGGSKIDGEKILDLYHGTVDKNNYCTLNAFDGADSEDVSEIEAIVRIRSHQSVFNIHDDAELKISGQVISLSTQSITGVCDFVKQGNGVLTITGSENENVVSGKVKVEAGVLNVDSKSISMGGFEVGAGATLNLATSDTIVCTGGTQTIDGSLVLNSALDIAGVFDYDGTCTYSDGTDGYRITQHTLIRAGEKLELGENFSLRVSGAEVTDYSLTNNSLTTAQVQDKGIYWVYSKNLAYNAEKMGEALWMKVEDGASLCLSATDTEVIEKTSVATGGSVIVADGVSAGISFGGEFAKGSLSVTFGTEGENNTFSTTGKIGDSSGSVSIESGIWELTEAQRYTGGTLIKEGATLKISGGSGSGASAIRGTVDVLGGTLELAMNDATGYGDRLDKVQTINLGSTEHAGGTLYVSDGANQTMGDTIINMYGGTITDKDSGGTSAGKQMDLFGNGTAVNVYSVGGTADAPTVSTIDITTLNLRQDDTTFFVDSNAKLTIASAIGDGYAAGNHNLVKTGDGVLEISKHCTYSGSTKINEGTLTVSATGELGSGEKVIAAGATLRVLKGSVMGGNTFRVGGTFDFAETGNNFDTITLSLHDRSVLRMALDADGASGNIVSNLEVSEAANKVLIDLVGTDLVAGKTYTLMTYTSSCTATADNFELLDATLAGKYNIAFALNEKKLQLSLSAKDNALVWQGSDAADDTWNAATDNTPWENATGVASAFTAGSVVNFDTSAPETERTVNLSGSLSAQAAYVSGTGWQWTGTGDVSTTGELVLGGKDETTLTISSTGAKTFTGGVLINDGAKLVLMNVDNWSGSISGAGTLELNLGKTIGFGTIGSMVKVAGDALDTLSVASGTVTEFTDGQSLTIASIDTIDIQSGAQFANRVDVSAENVTIGSNQKLHLAGAGAFTYDNQTYEAALSFGIGCTGSNKMIMQQAVTLTDDATIYVHAADGPSGVLAGIFTSNSHTLTKTGAGLLALCNAFTDEFKLAIQEGSLKFDGSALSGTGSADIANGATFHIKGNSNQIALTDVKMSSGSTLYLEGCTESLDIQSVSLAGGATMKLAASSAGIDKLSVSAADTSAAVIELQDSVSSISIAVGSVSGSGTLRLTRASENGTDTQIVRLTGANSFNGEWLLDRYNTLEAAHEDALANAVVTLDYKKSNNTARGARLKLDTKAAQSFKIKGLQGNKGDIIMTSPADIELQFNTAGGDYIYGGDFTPYNYVKHLVKDGQGSQRFTDIDFIGDITVKAGTLGIATAQSSAKHGVGRRITIAAGATLETALTLNGGTLSVDVSGGANAVCSLGNNTLTIGVGTTLDVTVQGSEKTGTALTLLGGIRELTVRDAASTEGFLGKLSEFFTMGVVTDKSLTADIPAVAEAGAADSWADRLGRSELYYEDDRLYIKLAGSILAADPLYWDPLAENGNGKADGNWLGVNWSQEDKLRDPGRMQSPWPGEKPVSVVFDGALDVFDGPADAEVVVDTDAVVTDMSVKNGSYTFVQGADENQQPTGSLAVEGKLSVATGASADMKMDINAYQVEVQGSLTSQKITLGKTAADSTVSAGSLTAAAGSTLSIGSVAGKGSVSITGATFVGTSVLDGSNSISVEVGSSTVAPAPNSSGATLTLSDATLTDSIKVEEGGALSMSGAMHLDTSGNGFAAEDTSVYSDGDDGFKTEHVKYTVVTGLGDTDATGATWTVGTDNKVGEYNDGVVSVNGTQDTTTYWVNTQRELSAISSQFVTDGTGKTSTIKLNGGMLTLDAALGTGIGIVTNNENATDKDSDICIGSGQTLSKNRLTIAQDTTVTLSGSGTYDIGSDAALGTDVVLGVDDTTTTDTEPTWTGTVSSAATSISDINALGNMNSAVELTSAVTGSGAMRADAVGTTSFKQGLTLEKDASLAANALELESLTLGYLNPGEATPIVCATELLKDKLNITISLDVLQGLKQDDSCLLVQVVDDDSRAALSLNGNADATYGPTGSKYLYTLRWEEMPQNGVATLATDNSAAGTTTPPTGGNAGLLPGVVGGDVVVLAAAQNPNYVQEKLAPTEQNAQAGAELLDDAFVARDPQNSAPDSDLAAIMDAVDAGAMSDKDLAAVAGASIATMGMALSGDVERQLSAIRNRTTSMGVNECVVNEGMPYFNAWVNAEGNRAELDKDGTDAGYKLDSWGGTVGFDVDLNPNLTMGMALTAMYGDLTADGPETKAEGDMDTYYVSLFARYASCAWTHTFVATVGMMDGSLNRTVNIGGRSYDTEGSVDGVTFGLLYEVGYVMPLNEEATACLQPVFNVMLRHTSIGSYTEEGSDAALDVDSQSMTTLTFGLGARMQAVVGENLYNRASIFEARALAKVDLGDRRSETDVAFVGGSRSSEIRSAELGAFGVELGAGLTIPLGDDDGSIFVDGAVELQSGYTNVNATVGYRINF